jgi:TRAP-type mannitol/chloroaromatic compound transport system permease small subunit
VIETALRSADRLSRLIGGAAMVMIAALVLVVFSEVVARYAFDSPTVWAYDITYMLNGVIYLLGAGLALSKNLHVRIDFLSTRLPVRVQHGVNLLFYAVLFLPVFGLVTRRAAVKALRAFSTGELEPVSPWAPLIWPFYAGIAIGLACLWLQALAETVRHGIGAFRPDRVPAPGVQDAH